MEEVVDKVSVLTLEALKRNSLICKIRRGKKNHLEKKGVFYAFNYSECVIKLICWGGRKGEHLLLCDMSRTKSVLARFTLSQSICKFAFPEQKTLSVLFTVLQL